MKQAPWWAGLLFSLLTFCSSKYPDYKPLIDSLITGLAATWGAHIVNVVKNGNGKGH